MTGEMAGSFNDGFPLEKHQSISEYATLFVINTELREHPGSNPSLGRDLLVI